MNKFPRSNVISLLYLSRLLGSSSNGAHLVNIYLQALGLASYHRQTISAVLKSSSSAFLRGNCSQQLLPSRPIKSLDALLD